MTLPISPSRNTGITPDRPRPLGPDMDWHVRYTSYLERIADGKARSGWTSDEALHVGMVMAWRDDVAANTMLAADQDTMLAYCWTVEPSLRR